MLADRFDFDKGTNVTQKYTRLVWEPYMQDAKLDPNAGDYTNVEDGDWWTSKIPTGPGSQDDPQPLSFFTDAVADGGAGWNNVNVFAFAVHQGTTTEATSIVSSITYQGTEVAIGKADLTPFDQADIDEAVAPVQDELDTYKAGHSISDDVNINWSRAALVGTPVHGKTVSVKLSGTEK